jgi:ribonuclease HI
MQGALMFEDEGEGLKPVTIYTDGACLGNPGPGGYGAVLIYGEKRRELSVGYRLTTNNRMEIMAVIAGLELLRYPCAVTVYTDSQYVANSIMKGWARKWRNNGWMRNAKERAVNIDLWGKMLDLCEVHQIAFRWVRGHAGDTENERCDALSVAAAKGKDLLIDEVYERENGAR